jgi:hypothetical protein
MWVHSNSRSGLCGSRIRSAEKKNYSQSLRSDLFACGGKRSGAYRNHAQQVSIAEKEVAEQGRGPTAREQQLEITG